MILLLWLGLAFSSFGILGANYVFARRAAKRAWNIRRNTSYMPKVSVIIPTHNECEVIEYKLRNLAKLEYPKNLLQMVFIDSGSTDCTVDKIRDFAKENPTTETKMLVESERRGKSAALNSALKHCEGDVVLVSDADCFWPSDILHKALPFLGDQDIGAVSGAKVLLGSNHSWVAKNESAYLDSMNLIKLGESKIGSTLLFEGGFSAYKKGLLDSFDPYNTGSDDCGTIVSLAEKNYRAIFVPDVRFYTAFPDKWKEKMTMKMRRSGQLVRVFWKYLVLLSRQRIKKSKRTIIPSVFIYLFCPILFVFFLAVTAVIFISYPYLIALLLLFLVPRVGSMLVETFQGFLVLFLALLEVASGKNFLIWQKPADRCLLTEEMLRGHDLI